VHRNILTSIAVRDGNSSGITLPALVADTQPALREERRPRPKKSKRRMIRGSQPILLGRGAESRGHIYQVGQRVGFHLYRRLKKSKSAEVRCPK
jgi:hypothetical protein